MFATVLHNLKSPENVGIIVRTHVAFGGGPLIIVGPEPWRFKKRARAFSRRLERLCRILHISTDDAFFKWCDNGGFTPVAIEISKQSKLLPRFRFPENPAIIVGNEGIGLHENFLCRIQHIATIPQFGPVECLNAAVSCCIAIYECNRNRTCDMSVEGHKFVIEQDKHMLKQ